MSSPIVVTGQPAMQVFASSAPCPYPNPITMQKGNVTTEYRQSLVGKILQAATAEFKQRGVKAVKMDDIARKLSVSKRTVYELYENKEKLLMASVVEEHRFFEEQMSQYIMAEERTVIDIVLMFYRLQLRNLRGVSAAYLTELHRYKAIDEYIIAKRQERKGHTQEFYKKGIEEGTFRADVNFELIDHILTESVDYIILHHLYERYEPIEVFRNLVMLYLRGCCTLKGIAELEQKMKEC